MNQEIPDELEIERMRAFVESGSKANDLLALERWHNEAREHMMRLARAVELLVQAQGGTLGTKIRLALEGALVREINGANVVLCDGVERESFGVHVLPDQVIVDVRLVVGRAKLEASTLAQRDGPG